MKATIKSERNYGHGSITVLKNAVRLISTSGDVYDIAKEDVAEYCKLPKDGKKIENAAWTINKPGTQLYNIHPWSGKYFGEFVKFSAKEGEQPRWHIQEGGPRQRKDGRSWMAEDKAVFSVIGRITAGDWENVEWTKNFDYAFQPDADGMTEIVGKAKVVSELKDGLTLFGLDLDTLGIRYTDNILPELEQEILNVNTTAFEVDFEEGWPVLSELPVGMAAPKRQTKKPAAKAPAKPAAPAPKAPVQSKADASKMKPLAKPTASKNMTEPTPKQVATKKAAETRKANQTKKTIAELVPDEDADVPTVDVLASKKAAPKAAPKKAPAKATPKASVKETPADASADWLPPEFSS